MPSPKTALSPAMHSVLTEMVRAEDAGDYENAELAQEGLEAWLGTRRVSARTVVALERLMLIGADSGGSVRYYLPTSSARHVLARPELLDEMHQAVALGHAFTITPEHKLELLD